MLGYDVWTRLVYGARTSLLVGFGAVAISMVIGTILGIVSGYYGGTVDQVIGRITDAILSMPALLLVAVFVSVVGPSLQSVLIVIALLTWPSITRLVRGQYLTLREAEFVTAARIIGVTNRSIMQRHLLPNIFGPLSVAATFYTAQAILLEAALSFLGLGREASDTVVGQHGQPGTERGRAPAVPMDLDPARRGHRPGRPLDQLHRRRPPRRTRPPDGAQGLRPGYLAGSSIRAAASRRSATAGTATSSQCAPSSAVPRDGSSVKPSIDDQKSWRAIRSRP